MTTLRQILAVSTLTLTLGVLSCAPQNGLHVELRLGEFQQMAATAKRFVITASGGFQALSSPTTTDFVTYATQDLDGDHLFELVVTVSAPFPTKSFLIDTKNKGDLSVRALLTMFDTTKAIAAGVSTTMVPAGGRGELVLLPSPGAPGPEGPSTRSTDLLTQGDVPKFVVKGPAPGARVSTLAACALDGDGKRNDLVIGSPSVDRDATRVATGAVYVVFDVDAKSTVTLGNDSSQLTIYGAESGDQMGAAVACADLDGDGFDDLLLGAPFASAGSGRVYVVLGRQALSTHAVDLDPTATNHPADIVWGPSSAPPAATVQTKGFGAAIFAVPPKAPAKGSVLVADLVRKSVHWLPAPAVLPAPALVDVDVANHPTLTGVSGRALAAGDLDGVATGLDIAVADADYVADGDVKPKGAVFLYKNVVATSMTAIDVAAATTTMVGMAGGYATSVLALDTTGRGQDLYVGVPNGTDGNGAVFRYEHDGDFFLQAKRASSTFKGTPLAIGETNGAFGSALGACRGGSGAVPTWTLVVGAPATTHADGRTHGGAAYVLDANASLVERLYGVASQDGLGTAVTCADLNGDAIGDLVTVAPGAKGIGDGAGVVYGLVTHP